MECESIDNHRDQSPYFFRIPSPIASPRHVCPNGTKKDAYGEQHHRWIQQQFAMLFQHRYLIGGSAVAHTHHESGDAVHCHKRKQRIGNHNHRHMRTQQRRLQHRHQLRHPRVGEAHHRHHRSHSAEQHAHWQSQRHATLGKHRYRHCAPSQKQHRLIAV